MPRCCPRRGAGGRYDRDEDIAGDALRPLQVSLSALRLQGRGCGPSARAGSRLLAALAGARPARGLKCP